MTADVGEGAPRMPHLIGLFADDARLILKGLGMKSVWHGLVHEGFPPVVVSQTPEPGELVLPDTRILIRADSSRAK